MSTKLALPLAASLLCLACAHRQDRPPETITWAAQVEASASRSEALTAEDIVMLRYVVDVELSPDAKQIAHVLRVPPPLDEPGRSRSQIWLVDAAGKSEPRRLTAEDQNSSSPRWSPDGRELGFLSKRPGDAFTSVYAMPIDGGEAQPLFEPTSSIAEFEWSPDGKQIAYTSARETEADKKTRKAGRDWIVDEAGGTKKRLFVWDRETGEERELKAGRHVIDFAWSPKGDRLVLRTSERPTIDHEMMYSSLLVIDAAGTAEPTPLAATAGKLGDIAWSPDGRQVAFLGAADIHDSTSGIVYVADADAAGGGQARALTAELEATVSAVEWLDPKTLVLLTQRSTVTTIDTLAVAGGPPKTRIADGPICHDLSVGPRGALACAGDGPNHPGEVYFAKPGQTSLARLTVANPSLLERKLGEQRVIEWKAEDGLELEGVVILPVDYQAKTRYPLAVLPHGGPEGISQHGWNTRPNYPAQLFATRGYVVFMPNYRGSRGRGTGFAVADQNDLGGKEFTDVLAGIAKLAADGLVDDQRVGMGGWSYGGYFSALAATTYSEHFKAAVIAAAITNWISFTGTTEIEHENSLVHWNLWPWDDMELAWDRSPLAHAKGSTTAALIVHGLADTRVPVGQSEELYRALRHLGTTTQLVMYPREGHGISENVHGLDFAARFVDWFDAHVKN